MVSADNLPFDIVVLILAHVSSRTLCNAAAVSRAFNGAATPILYRSISLRSNVNGILMTLTARPDLAGFVRRIIVPAGPGRSENASTFVTKISRILRACLTLEALSVSHDATVLALLQRGVLVDLNCLRDVNLHLGAVRRPPSMQGEDPAALLEPAFAQPRRITSLLFRAPPVGVISRMLPWLARSGPRLTELRLADASLLELGFLQCLLSCTPGLRVLHLARTLGAEALTLLHLVPELRDLGITIRTAGFSRAEPVALLHLVRVTFFVVGGIGGIAEHAQTLGNVSQWLSASPISDMSLVADARAPMSASAGRAAPDGAGLLGLDASDIAALTSAHRQTLKRFVCPVPLSPDAIATLLAACPHLEQLSIPLPKASESALRDARALRVLVLGPRSHDGSSLTSKDALAIARACPTLRKLLHGARTWRVVGSAPDLHVHLESESLSRY